MTSPIDEGTRLGDGRYILESRLGTGGAATVWLSADTVLERPVAIKILSEGLASDESWLARFRREARLAAGLSHHNLVSVYDFAADARPYIVMAYMPGGSLWDRLQAGDALDPERLARDVLAALAAIHSAGIIHRDIKPGNLLFAADGAACLTDFGIARPEDATSLTQTGHIPGTARFMAPELWHGYPADERSDLYAAGIVLRQAIGDDASPGLDALIDRLAAEEPAERPASAAEALAEIGSPRPAAADPHFADPTPTVPMDPPADAEPPLPSHPAAARSDHHPHRRAALAGLAILAAVAVVAIAQAVGGDDDGGSGSNAGSPNNGSGQSGRTADASGSGSGRSDAASESDETVDPVALDREGKALIDAGDPEAAIPILEQAVEYYPPDSRDIQYAYSLYNLGNALYLAGRPEEAIPYLEKRLTFDNQVETVQATLDAAEEAAGSEEGGPPDKPDKPEKPGKPEKEEDD